MPGMHSNKLRRPFLLAGLVWRLVRKMEVDEEESVQREKKRKKQGGRIKSSPVWEHIEETIEGRGMCKLCSFTFAKKSGTTTFKAHLERQHDLNFNEPKVIDQAHARELWAKVMVCKKLNNKQILKFYSIIGPKCTSISDSGFVYLL